MTVLVALGLGLLGGAGAVARHLLDGAVSARCGRRLPWGTLAVNLSGTLALGVLAGAALDGDAYRLAATGLLAAYTTFSTWMLESERLARAGRHAAAAANVGGSLAVGLALVWLGRELGRLL